jgi:cytochrome c-type biogenesis protein
MSFPVAFVAGLAAFFSPCILPLLPAWLAFMGGGRTGSKRALVLNLLAFAAGFTLVFSAMGAGATIAGQLLRQYRPILTRVAGGVIIVFGLQMLGLFQLSFLARERKIKTTRGHSPFHSFLFGLVLALGWTPCTGMILGPIIMLAGNQETVVAGTLLLFTYSLGFALPFFVTGLVLGTLPRGKAGPVAHWVQIGTGVVMVLMGVLLLLDRWAWLQGLFI